jgi:hypothetical protein
MPSRQIRGTVSGSFRRAMSAIEDAVYALTDAGVRVLSPADPRVVDQFGDFLFVASDRVRAIKLVQSRHLAAIAASDFVWVVAPEGYIGQSGAMEVGYATAVGTPVYCSEVPIDLTLRQYVTTLSGPQEVLAELARRRRQPAHAAPPASVLLDPLDTVELAHDHLEQIATELTRDITAGDVASRAAEQLSSEIVLPLSSR